MEQNNNALKKLTIFHSAIVFISAVCICFVTCTQITHVNQFAATWDQVDFALALDRYDLMAMQPHFPGYPYFILGGYFFHLFIENKAASLTVFNIVIYLSCLYPIYQFARNYFSRTISVLIAALLYTSPYLLVSVNQPVSEGAALAVLWWYFWSLNRASAKNDLAANLLPLFLFSLLLGIRLSYLPFGIGLLFLFYKKWRNKQYKLSDIFTYFLFAILFQLIWLSALISTEGSIKGFMKLTLSFTSGHFNSWGNTAVSSGLSFLERLKMLVIDNLLWTGLSAESNPIAIGYFLVFLLFVYSLKLMMIKKHFGLQLAIVMGLCYFVWALVAQNVDKPRHILPLVLFLLITVFVVIFKKASKPIIISFCCILLIAQSYYSQALVMKQAKQEPAVYQLAAFLNEHNQEAIVYTWEETRVLEYLQVQHPHKRIYTYEVFLHDMTYYENKRIFITNKAVEGFKSQGVDLKGKIKKVKVLQSDSMYDPVYHDIVLYEWVRSSS